VIGVDSGGGSDFFSIEAKLADAIRTARGALRRFQAVDIFDSMARLGAPELRRLDSDGRLQIVRRREEPTRG
jgi:hypothetical protein